MGATIIKIKVDKNKQQNKPLSPLQQKILAAPIMTEKQFDAYKKNNKWMGKWKI